MLRKYASQSDAWQVLIACWFIKFCCGGLAPSGTIHSYHIYIAEDWGVAVSSVTMMSTVMCLTTMATAAAMGRLMRRFPPKRVIQGSGFIGILGYLLCATAQKCWHLYLCGAMIGVACACLTYSAVPFMINLWFRKNTGTYVGIAVTGQSVGKLLFAQACTSLIVKIGWRATIVAFGLLSGTIFFTTTGILLKNKSSTKKSCEPTEPSGSPLERTQTQEPLAQLSGDPGTNSKVFWSLAIAAFLGGYCLSVNSSVVSIAKTSQALSPANTGLATTAVAIGMLIGEPLFGRLLDLSQHLWKPLGLFTGLQALGMILMANIYHFPQIVLMACVLIGMGVGSTCSVLIAYVCRKIFGSRTYNQHFQKLVSVISAANAASCYLTNYIYDVSGSYAAILYVMAGMTVLIFLFVLLALRLYVGYRQSTENYLEV